eukprot:3850694-Amphidinium_carterae.4
MTTRTKLIFLLTTVCVIMTTYHSCFGLQVDTSTRLSYNCYYDMEGDDFDISEMTTETIKWASRIEGDTEHDLIKLQKMQDMQDDMTT